MISSEEIVHKSREGNANPHAMTQTILARDALVRVEMRGMLVAAVARECEVLGQ